MKRTKMLAIFVCLLFIGTIFLASATTVVAPKPEKPPKPDPNPDPEPEPTGTIYYAYTDDGVGYDYTMNPDGSAKTKLGGYVGGAMSREKHGGHFWCLYFLIVDGTYPDTQPHQEIFVRRDDGGSPVQLTDDITMATNYLCCPPTWGPGDEFISWSAYRWGTDSSGDYVYDAGIYKATVNYDGNQDITSIGTITLVYDSGYWGDGAEYYPVARSSLDWSPDGEKIVYGTNDGTYLYDTVSKTSSFITVGGNARWSPDGSMIEYIKSHDLWIIKSDGTDASIVVDVTSTGAWHVRVVYAYWSPDGEFLTYLLYKTSVAKPILEINSYIYVVQKDGTDNVDITKGLTNHQWKIVRAWH